jgi:GH15 family glucan-1,4-alpha-glucosidase
MSAAPRPRGRSKSSTASTGADLPEEVVDHLEGYRGSAPVRLGNVAATQLQLDIYGDLVDSVHLDNKFDQPISSGDWDGLTRIVEWVCDHWDQPDEGTWETRAGPQRFMSSRLQCWVAIERAIRVASQRGLPADLARWPAERDRIYRRITQCHSARRLNAGAGRRSCPRNRPGRPRNLGCGIPLSIHRFGPNRVI